MKPLCRVRPLVFLAALLPLAATAHTGPLHTHGAGAGFLHPFTGLDHLLAMLAAGLWAAQLGGRARWALPLAFAGMAATGLLAGLAGLRLPGVEALVLASVAALGLVLAGAARWPWAAGVMLAAAFAFAHGLAHGQELPAPAASLGYGAGFVGGTAALLAAGLGLGTLAAREGARRWVRAAGAGIALVAVGMAVA